VPLFLTSHKTPIGTLNLIAHEDVLLGANLSTLSALKASLDEQDKMREIKEMKSIPVISDLISDYFDGDASSYFDGDGYSSYDGDDFFSVDGDGKKRRQEKRDERKEKRKDRADERKGKREDRADERKERQDERRELRSQKKKAKIDEIEARNKLTESLSQPDQTADLLKSMQDPMETKSATEKKGMSTTTIILIATGGLVVLGLTAFLLLRRKK